jgi:hypothetical protein
MRQCYFWVFLVVLIVLFSGLMVLFPGAHAMAAQPHTLRQKWNLVWHIVEEENIKKVRMHTQIVRAISRRRKNISFALLSCDLVMEML